MGRLQKVFVWWKVYIYDFRYSSGLWDVIWWSQLCLPIIIADFQVDVDRHLDICFTPLLRIVTMGMKGEDGRRWDACNVHPLLNDLLFWNSDFHIDHDGSSVTTEYETSPHRHLRPPMCEKYGVRRNVTYLTVLLWTKLDGSAVGWQP